MKVEDFIIDVLRPEPHVRAGQRLMTRLAKIKPHLYNAIDGTNIDCFYDDNRMWTTLEWLYENWSVEEPQLPRKIY